MAAVVSAAVFASAFGPGAAALAADIRVGPAAEISAAESGRSAIQPLSLIPSLTAPILSPLSAPALTAPSTLPELGGHARPRPAVAVPSMAPAAVPTLAPAPASLPALAAPADGPIGRLGAWFSSALGRPAAAPAGQEPGGSAGAEDAGAAKARAGVPFGEDSGSPRSGADDATLPSESAAAPAPALAPAGRLAGLAAAESRVRASAKGRAEHLRLLRVSADLRGDVPRWTFAYHAPAKGQILTFGPKGVETRRLAGGEKPVMLRQEELAAADLDRALAGVNDANPGFKPVRAEILPRATGGFTVLFYDARGAAVKAPAAAKAATLAVPAPAAEPQAVVAPAAIEAEPILPSNWTRLPAEAREADSAALLAAKAEAQTRARRLAPDARLVSVAVNLEDPRSHWIFTFRSDKRREELTVWTKRVSIRKLGFRPTKAPSLRDGHLMAMGPLERAYAAVEKAAPSFRPVRVEVDPAWNGPASYRFLDLDGRAVSVGADGTARLPSAPLTLDASLKNPPSFALLPEDARGADGRSLRALKTDAEARARRLAPDARLIRAAINLDEPNAHWMFVFRSDKSRAELTVWTKRIQTRRLPPRARPAATLSDEALGAVAPIAAAYAALKKAKPGLKPVRAELAAAAEGAAAWSFLDSRGRGTEVEAAARPAPVPPEAGVPEERGPPAETPAPPAAVPPSTPDVPVPPVPPLPPAAKPAPSPAPQIPAKYVYEDFLGFRTVRGVKRDAALGRLPANADSPRIIAQISGQFGIPREDVLKLAAKFRLDEMSSREDWFGIYDRLQSANRDQFKRFDSKKYAGWSSFRELANLTYAPGWRGALRRASELHKHFLGGSIRFPYHLFDMFLFGYFRQAIAFEFGRSGEDFLSLSKEKDLARKWLEAAMRQQSFRGAGTLGSLRAKTWFRATERWFLTPLAKPLATFLVRRLTLAVMSAIAMGVLGAFAPALPLSFALTAIPWLGPGIVWALNGIPVLTAAVPFVGQFLAPVVAAAVGALAKDLVLGPLLNTMILSTLLTFPAAARERMAAERDRHPQAPLTAGELARAIGGTALTWTFWRSNVKSFFGLATVGAEIAGIMTYAASIDTFVDPGFQAVTGHKIGLFEKIGAAVERPKGESPIPFGGAITWGSVLLYKLQDASGIHISEAVMGATLGLKSFAGFEGGADAGHAPAAAVVHAAETREGFKTPFDPDLWMKAPGEVAARIKELAASAGGLDAELSAVKTQMETVRARLGDKEAKLDLLRKKSNPVTPEERAEYDRLLSELGAKRDESYVQSKLSQISDLKNPASDEAAELKRLKALQDKYRAALPPPPPDRNGYWDQLATQEASYKALSARLKSFADGGPVVPDGPLPRLDPKTREAIEKLVGEIETQRAEVQGEMTQRDATASLIKASNQIRNHALSERRNGQDMLRFHTDFAKLATVMDLALSLNEIAAAQAAIQQMMNLLQAKQAAVNASNQQNQQNLQNAAANQAQIAQWQKDAQNALTDDQTSQKNMADQEAVASLAAVRSAGFQQQVGGLIAAINAADKGTSVDAAAQYQKNLNTLSQVAQWRTSGNPNDATAFSLAGFQANLAQVNGYLAQARSGLTQIAGVPVEFAGALVIEVPGPQVNVTNPTRAQTLQILADRRTYWTQQMATYQADLTKVNNLMDPNYVLIDEFGLPHSFGKSMQNMASLHPGAPAAGSKLDAQQDLAQLDTIASELNGMTGSHIPLLSGLSLTDLQTAIKTYGDSLKAVKFPASNGDFSPQVKQAELDLILAAQLTPMAARAIVNWSVDQATVDAFNKAKAPGGALTAAQQGLTAVVGMLNKILSDVDADVNFVNTGAGGGQALIDRKTALLNNSVIPPLTQAQGMLNTLIAYQQGSIADVQGNGSQYYKLFSGEQTLLTQTQDLYNKTLPWALASFGGSPGDVPGSLASIANWKQSLNKYITGYTDSNGRAQQGITQYQKDMVDRQCATGCGRTEVLYGETQPYSLPAKISQYTSEQAARVAEINAQDATINDILTKIQTLSGGKYNLSAYKLPTGLGTDAASIAKIQALVDANTIPNLGTQLKTIGNAAQAAGGAGITINTGGSGTVPVGTQPSPTIGNNQQIALLALAAAERLVPSPNSQATATNAPEAYAVARYLYSNAVISAAKDALTNQVPQAVAFLQQASKALGDAIAQTDRDVAYVNSNGSSEAPDALYARKVAMFQALDAFLKQGSQFYILKAGWDQGAFGTISKIQTYYNSLNTIYTNGSTVNASETTAINTMMSALQNTYNALDQTKQKVTSWMSQLDPKQQSALKRVSDDVSAIQEKTRAVLEANINWHDLNDQLKRSRAIIASDLTQVDENQQRLAALLNDPDVQDSLPPDLVRRIESLRIGRSAFAMGASGGSSEAIVVKKSEFSSFLDTMLGMLTNGSQALAHQDVAAIKSDLLANPQGLAAFMPGSGIMDFGDNADGFYLVYQSKFSVPNGLETGSWVTLGNVAQLWGNNVSVNGYAFSSPPSPAGQNAPYGDKGVEVQVESLQNRSAVNYLNIDLHRFGLDIPTDNSVVQNVGESRMMIFDDYAMMLLGDKLYVGLAGYGDMALNQPGEHPYYYGGNLKTSLKLTEVMSLNASQQELFAKDPRSFLENVNMDFTGYDPTLNQNFAIMANGANKSFSRTQVGPQFDVNRLMHPDGGGDTFTVDLFYAKTAGTDDINQQSVGTTIVKGFSIKNDDGKTWLQIDNRLNGELGQKANTLGDRLSFTLPDKGITLSGEGQLIGDKSTHYAQLSKKTGENTSIALGYGSQYIGQNDRLSLTLNTSFTLAQLWQTVADNSAKNLQGGETLKKFNEDMSDFFGGKSKKTSRTTAELSKVYEADVARRLVSQDVGTLTRDIQDLRKAGAFLDNTRVRSMVGFTSNAASNNQAELAVGGGFTVGTYTEMTLSKTQKALIEDKAASLYREGLRLQDRLLQATKDWQAAVVDVAQAQWDVKLAAFQVANAPSEPIRREAEVRQASAVDALHQALLRYNSMTGRDPTSVSPFADLDAKDLKELMTSIQNTIAAPDRFTKILSQLDRDSLEKQLGPDPFNLMDWIPWVDRLTVGFGVQYQDILNTQALTLGVGVRLPIYDPASKDVNKAYRLEAAATEEEMAAAYRQRSLLAAGEHERALAWAASAAAIAPQGPAAAQRASDAIQAYRNGLVGPDELRAAFAGWRWYAQTILEAQSQASLAGAQEAVDAPMLPKEPLPSGPAAIGSLQDALDLAVSGSHDLAQVADRSKAAEDMARAEDHRIQKFWLTLNVGTGLTSTGLGFIPSIGITGIPITPVFGFELKPEELRELQVSQHDQQKAYYDSLKTRLEAGLAVQLYQESVIYRSASERLDLYRNTVLPRLQAAAAGGDADAARRLDQAYLERDQTAMAWGQARAALNLLLGREADAELTVNMDEAQAFAALSTLLAKARPVENQRAILNARVGVARAVEDMIDKNLKVNVLQLEPVSVVVRSLGRLMNALGGGPVYDADKAAAARISTLSEERARDAYDGQRADQAARLRLELNAALGELKAKAGDASPEAALRRNALEASVSSLKAGLLAIGEDPAASAPPGRSGMPVSWAEATRRLADAEQALTPAPPDGPPLVSPADVSADALPSGAYARYDMARQTLGHTPIDQNFVEGWIEIRLKNPNTPPDVLLALSKLRTDKAERIYRTQLAGASAQAQVLSAEFESDVRLLRWARARTAHPGDGAPVNLDRFMKDLTDKLGGERGRIVSLLGLPPDTALDALAALVPEDLSPSAGLPDLAKKLIDDIRARQMDSIRRTLFEDGLPQGFGGDDDLMSQIKANTISERMSYKGFTPVAAAGVFRGTTVSGAFLEAPDPREIERALENVMTDVLRKQLESDGRMRGLSLHLNQLMSQVQDGSRELEAQRRQIEAAEGDLKARTALAGIDAPETIAAQQRLLGAWSDFGRTMVSTKSAFITLVTELQALGQGSAGTLRPLQAPLRSEIRTLRRDSRSELLDYWTERMADPAFEDAQDALLAKTGAAVPADARARVRAAAGSYQQALKDADAVRDNEFTGAQKLDLLARNDVEGKRLALRAEIERAVAGLGALDPRSGPAASDLIAFFRADVDKAADAGTADRAQKRAVAEQLRRTFWGATAPAPEAEAAFVRLENLEKAADEKRQTLMADYLASASDNPKNFILKDAALDEYLKARSAFDAELAATLESDAFAKDDGMARVLDGLFDVRAGLDRAVDRAKYGRGMAALDALTMLEETRLRAARWGGRPPTEIDRVAESLQNLRDLRVRWLAADQDSGLEPVYALTRLGSDGARTWSVDEWLTLKEVQGRLHPDPTKPAQPGDVVERDGRLFIDDMPGRPGVRYELIGGVDAARAENDAAQGRLGGNDLAADIAAAMKTADFVAVGGPKASGAPKTEGLSFEDVFVGGKDAPSLYAQGRLFFFRSDKNGAALNPLAALSLPPEQVVIKYYDGDQPLARDRFPTAAALASSEEAARFRTLAVSPHGAAELASHARAYAAAQDRRGWIEVKLNSFGFARDAAGRVSQLYRTQDDFEAQWKAYDHADRDLAAAKSAFESAQAEEAARKADAAKAQTAYNAAQKAFTGVRASPEARAAMAREEAAAQAVKDSGRSTGPEKTEFDAAVHAYQKIIDSTPEKKAFDAAAKELKTAGDKFRDAKTKSVNSAKAVDDAVVTLEHSKTWTLYRGGDLDLSLDRSGGVVRAAAPPARGGLRLDAAVAGGGVPERRLSGGLSAAVVDEEGRLVRAFATSADVDAAAPGWNLVSYSPGGDVNARLDDGSVRTKVRLSHYEEKENVGGRAVSLPVLLSERYLIERLDASKSKLSTAEHWAIMPYNWGNILLEIPREVAQAPAELLAGRDLDSSHYLGRARMYKTEGGEVEHHGFFRTALGWVDVLNLLPDPVTRYYDPSQFPDSVRVDSSLKPGEILAQKTLNDPRNGKDVKFGSVAMTRQVRQATEDLDAARERTLARFNGGVEQVLLETRRGRAGTYQESTIRVQSGEIRAGDRMVAVVDKRLQEDPGLAAAPGSIGGSDVTASATPGALFVDRVESRTRVYPGAAGYERQAAAMDGYADRVAKRDAESLAARPALAAAQAKADELLKARFADRDRVADEERDLWNRWHVLAERIGLQEELERRITVLEGEIKDLKSELAWWDNYAAQLDAARRGELPGPVQPGQPGRPSGPNPMFWAWMLMLFALGSLFSALWYARRGALPGRPLAP
jgi:hypothetical protein